MVNVSDSIAYPEFTTVSCGEEVKLPRLSPVISKEYYQRNFMFQGVLVYFKDETTQHKSI